MDVEQTETETDQIESAMSGHIQAYDGFAETSRWEELRHAVTRVGTLFFA